ncbi:unnamed protein product, partial [Arabidopsis halleri]
METDSNVGKKDEEETFCMGEREKEGVDMRLQLQHMMKSHRKCTDINLR